MKNDKILITTTEAAEMLGISRESVVKMCDSGQIRCMMLGRNRMIYAATLKNDIARACGANEKRIASEKPAESEKVPYRAANPLQAQRMSGLLDLVKHGAINNPNGLISARSISKAAGKYIMFTSHIAEGQRAISIGEAETVAALFPGLNPRWLTGEEPNMMTVKKFRPKLKTELSEAKIFSANAESAKKTLIEWLKKNVDVEEVTAAEEGK